MLSDRKSSRQSTANYPSQSRALVLLLLGLMQVTADNPDLCPGTNLPLTYGYDDGYVMGSCMAVETFGTGFWFAGMTSSPTLIGTANTGAFAVHLDSSYALLDKIMFNDDSALGFTHVGACSADTTSDEAVFVMMNPLAVAFHTSLGSVTAYELTSGGTPLVDIQTSNGAYNQAIYYNDGVVYLGLSSDTGVDDPLFVAMENDGTVLYSWQFQDSATFANDVFTSIWIDGADIVTTTVQQYQAGGIVNTLSKFDIATGTLQWNVGEYYTTAYWIIYIFQDVQNDSYLMCNNGFDESEYELVWYYLNASGKPANHHYYLDYEFGAASWYIYRCAGAVISADGNSGTIAFNKFEVGFSSQQCLVSQADFANTNGSDFQQICIENSSSGLGQVSYNNPTWWDSSSGTFHVLYLDVEVGHLTFPNFVTVISSIDLTEICNDFYHTSTTAVLNESGFTSSYDLYFDTTGDVTPTAVTIGTSVTLMSVVTIIEDISGAIQPCEILEIANDPIDLYFPEQQVVTFAHDVFTVYLDTCFGSTTVTYDSFPHDGLGFPSWLTYTAATRTYAITTGSIASTYAINITATTEGTVVDTENTFNLILTPVNFAPVITAVIIDEIIDVFATNSQYVLFTDQDVNDNHSITCLQSDGTAIPSFVDCSWYNQVAFTPTDNDNDPGVYIIDVTLCDDDADATGSVQCAASIQFTLTVNVGSSDTVPFWSGSFKERIYVDLSETKIYVPPPYGAPSQNEDPFENVTMMDNGNSPPGFVTVHRLPMYLEINPTSPSEVGDYTLNVTIFFYNYGTGSTTYILEGELNIIVTNYEPCFVGHFPDITMKLDEVRESKIVGWEEAEFEKPCVGLIFIFRLENGSEKPEFMFNELSRWISIEPTEEKHTGIFQVSAFAKDYIINERLINTFTVNVREPKTFTTWTDDYQYSHGEDVLKIKGIDINEEGEVEIEFTKVMQILSELDAFKDPYPAFDFYINTHEGGYDRYVQNNRGKSNGRRNLGLGEPFGEQSKTLADGDIFTDNLVKDWDCVRMSDKKMIFRLSFDNKYKISQKLSWDKLHVDILDSRNLVSSKGERLSEQNIGVLAPPQLNSGDSELLDTLAWLIYSMIAFTLFVLMPITIFSGGSTQLLWIHLSCVQLIAHLPMMGTFFPNNIEKLLSSIIDITNFKFIEINPFLGIYRSKEDVNLQGYSDNFIFSLGFFFVICVVSIALGVFLYYSYVFMFEGIRCTRRPMLWLGRNTLFNFYLRLGLQGFLIFSIASFKNMDQMSFEGSGNIIASIFSILVAISCSVTPFLLSWFLVHYRYDLPFAPMIDQAETLYNEQKTHMLSGLLYNVLFVIRRLVLAFVLVAFEHIPAVQFQPVAMVSMACAFYSYKYSPFLYKDLNFFDVFNEATIFVLCCLVGAFTDYNLYEAQHYEIGKVWIGIFLTNYFISFFYLLGRTLYFLNLKMKKKTPKKYNKMQRYVKQRTPLCPTLDLGASQRSLLHDSQKAKISPQDEENKENSQLLTDNPLEHAEKKVNPAVTKKKRRGESKKGVNDDDNIFPGMVPVKEVQAKRKKHKDELTKTKRTFTTKKTLKGTFVSSLTTIQDQEMGSSRSKRTKRALKNALTNKVESSRPQEEVKEGDNFPTMERTAKGPALLKTKTVMLGGISQGPSLDQTSKILNPQKGNLMGETFKTPDQFKARKPKTLAKNLDKRLSGFFNKELTNKLAKE